jgi:hypothetical protein
MIAKEGDTVEIVDGRVQMNDLPLYDYDVPEEFRNRKNWGRSTVMRRGPARASPSPFRSTLSRIRGRVTHRLTTCGFLVHSEGVRPLQNRSTWRERHIDSG